MLFESGRPSSDTALGGGPVPPFIPRPSLASCPVPTDYLVFQNFPRFRYAFLQYLNLLPAPVAAFAPDRPS